MTTYAKTTAHRAARPFRRFGLAELLGLARQRTALAHLDQHLLDDLGITRDEARAEASRPIWDVPSNWRA